MPATHLSKGPVGEASKLVVHLVQGFGLRCRGLDGGCVLWDGVERRLGRRVWVVRGVLKEGAVGLVG